MQKIKKITGTSIIDLTNQVFDRWKVLKFVGTNNLRASQWLCACDCGTERIVSSNSLRSGQSKSCGCFNIERTKITHTTHNMTRSNTYLSWVSMLQRCNNPRDKRYKDYGGRGIKVCKKWQGKNGFINFLKDMGERPKEKTLDRIKNNKGYYKKNCKWSSRYEQSQNKRNVKLFTFNNKTQSLMSFSREFNVPYSTLRNRIFKLKMPIELALNTKGKIINEKVGKNIRSI